MKSATICIKREISPNTLGTVYGKGVFQSSLFNFPRSCDYSLSLNLLAVSDTYHNRICIFDLYGNFQRAIKNVKGIIIRWPRCAKWYGEDLLIACSLDNAILCTKSDGKEKWLLDLNQIVSTHEWIQSIEQQSNSILIAYESFFVIVDLRYKTVIYDSRPFIEFKDLHQAQFLESYILVADTGNNRIVKLSGDNFLKIEYYTGIVYGKDLIDFNKPRMVYFDGRNTMVVNSGTSQIWICDSTLKRLITVLGEERGFGEYRFSIPRWISPGPHEQIFISDTDNHRVALRSLNVNEKVAT